MELRIVHTTGYEYDGKAVASYNQARMTPVTTPEQIVVHSRLEVTPKPWSYEYRDYFGTQVTAFEVVDPHESLTVTATSTVHTSREPAPPRSLPWEAMNERDVADRWTEYLTLPDLVLPPTEFASQAAEIAASSGTPGEAARELCAVVSERVEHRPGVTDVQSVAADAWEHRAGVCQDMTHLVMGGLRSVGIPARYVSGYFHPKPEPVVGQPVVGESHAWVEWWDDGWTPYDVTNAVEVDDRYVVVATGRDYTDVKPLEGLYSGTATSQMFVEVEITRLA